MWKPKGITNSPVDKYLYSLLPKSSPVLRDMERYADRHDVPIVGPAVGRLFFLLAQLAGARRIFEMGSAIGYSTLWFAQASGDGGEVHYSDGSQENAKRAHVYFHRAGLSDRIHIHVGVAQQKLAETPGEFDIIFIDVDKEQYPETLRQAVPRVRRGGLLIADNTLWSGRAARKAPRGDTRTHGIQQFNRMAFASTELFPVMVPLRDGVTICRKL
ncbi:MAG TPA: O-methyltransferase [Candidatus Acidoferrales bacterium]|nr:O-methyltransferase [Candidatus Acidoferrales bacterium]